LAIRPECKKSTWKSKAKEIKNSQDFNRQNGESRNCCRVNADGVGVEGMMTLEKVGAHV